MRVAFITRATLYTSPGGDTTQIEQTALHLGKLGVEVQILLTTQDIDYAAFDLLHFFNIIRPADILYHIEHSDKPFVVSTIYVEFGEYEKKNRRGLIGWLNRHIDANTIEYLKTIARFAVNGEKIRSFSYLRRGHYQSIRHIMKRAKVLLPNSKSEYERVERHFKHSCPYFVIPNAVDVSWYYKEKSLLPEFDGKVLCVGRIEGRKNQLNLIKALQGTEIGLVIIGEHSPNHQSYFQECQAAAGPNVTFLGQVSGQRLYDIYHSAKVHVLPSFFETTGLSSLEAALMGCNLVITDKGDTREYFGDNAFYCDPEDLASIRTAVEKALASPYESSLRNKILLHYTWDITAAKTLEAYHAALTL